MVFRGEDLVGGGVHSKTVCLGRAGGNRACHLRLWVMSEQYRSERKEGEEVQQTEIEERVSKRCNERLWFVFEFIESSRSM